jgi:CRP-like cAMP-binding protein
MFADLSDDDADAVLRLLKARRGGPGQTLFHEGDPGATLMILVEGELEATVTSSDRSQKLLQVIEPGHVVGELAFLDASPRWATVSTRAGAVVLEFSRQALLALCRDHPRIGATLQRRMLSDLSQRIRAIEAALDSLNATSARAASVPPPSARHASVHPPASDPEARESVAPLSARPRAWTLTAEQLRAFPVLASHATEDLELLAYMATARRFARGEPLMRMGTVGDAAFLILEGSVEISRGSMPLATLEAGALVGQLALLDRARRSVTVTAMAETIALELKPDVFSNLVQASSPLALRFQREVATAAARRLRAETERFASMSGDGPERLSYGEIDTDWSTGKSDDAPIELDVDLDVLRR